MTQVTRYLLIVLIVIILGGAGFAFLTMPDQRTAGQRMDDAIGAFRHGDGAGKAAEQLEKRTPGQKLGDAIKDNTANKNQ